MAFKELSPSEKEIVLQCMKAIADGPEIEDWEFHTRLGIVRPTLRRVISLWPEIDDGSEEKLGRNDLCPCGSGRRFQALLPARGQIRRQQPRLLFSESRKQTCEKAKKWGSRNTLDFRFLFAYSAGR